MAEDFASWKCEVCREEGTEPLWGRMWFSYRRAESTPDSRSIRNWLFLSSHSGIELARWFCILEFSGWGWGLGLLEFCCPWYLTRYLTAKCVFASTGNWKGCWERQPFILRKWTGNFNHFLSPISQDFITHAHLATRNPAQTVKIQSSYHRGTNMKRDNGGCSMVLLDDNLPNS